MIPISDTLLSRTTELRHRLHTCPESSGNEVRTAMLLKQFLSEYTSLELQDCGAGFYAAHREPDTAVPDIALRADYDPFPATVNDPACAEKVRSACNGTILPEPPCAGEVAYYDNAGVVCRCWNWRDSQRTCVRDDTTNEFIVMECVEPERVGELRAAVDELAQLLEAYAGAKVFAKAILDTDHRELIIQA